MVKKIRWSLNGILGCTVKKYSKCYGKILAAEVARILLKNIVWESIRMFPVILKTKLFYFYPQC